MSWLEQLHEAQAKLAAQNADPWQLRLERVRGQVGDDGVERITTQYCSTSSRFLNAAEEPGRAAVLRS